MEARSLFTFVFLLTLIFASQESMGKICETGIDIHCGMDEQCKEPCAALGYPIAFCEFHGLNPRICGCRKVDC
ncbi:hypothetical protein ACP275_13G122100 [Erythranthe tilingii]